MVGGGRGTMVVMGRTCEVISSRVVRDNPAGISIQKTTYHLRPVEGRRSKLTVGGRAMNCYNISIDTADCYEVVAALGQGSRFDRTDASRVADVERGQGGR